LINYRSALAYLHRRTAAIPRSYEAMGPVLEGKATAQVREFQGMIPKRETLLVWTETPFLLDYRRNRILDMNVAGMSQPWGKIALPRYVLWQSSGYGIATPESYRYVIDNVGRRDGELESRALDVFLWLQSIASESKVIRSSNGTVLFETSGRTPRPPN
jgi:hypothetical protein